MVDTEAIVKMIPGRLRPMEVVRYRDDQRSIWNAFVEGAKNGLFLFDRNYMEYHSERFKDCSLMFVRGSELIGLMPATIEDKVLTTHGGLTFGGILSDKNMKTPLMLDVFKCMREHLREEGVERVVYKAIPYIYHSLPSDEDLYALHINQARLIRRDVSSTIVLTESPGFSRGRRWSIKQAIKHGVEVTRSDNFREFMAIEENLLTTKYNLKPVHTADEMVLLSNRFPDNIKLFSAEKAGNMLAGVIIYESKNVAHAQYISANDEGKRIGALDLVMDFLLNNYYSGKKYFDFGISTENGGLFLNCGLIENKEGFGARAIVHDFYEMNVACASLH